MPNTFYLHHIYTKSGINFEVVPKEYRPSRTTGKLYLVFQKQDIDTYQFITSFPKLADAERYRKKRIGAFVIMRTDNFKIKYSERQINIRRFHPSCIDVRNLIKQAQHNPELDATDKYLVVGALQKDIDKLVEQLSPKYLNIPNEVQQQIDYYLPI